MGNDTTVNGMSPVTEKSGGKVVAFPDVCLTPAGTATVPIPYPNISQSSDLAKGSKKVKINGAPVCLKDSEISKSTGDEAGSSNGIASGKTCGKATPVNYSTNVKIEGKNAVRNMDMFLGNNKNTPPFPILQPNPAPSVAVADKEEEEKKYSCDWKDCKGEHDEEIDYPESSKGKINRGVYTGDWEMPWNSGLSENKSLKITINHYTREVKKKRIKEAKAKFGTNEYPVDNHHLIPISSLNELDALKHNAKLVGWDINHSDNGVCLPYFVTDVYRHDLQCHRTSHPSYSKKVERELKQLETECVSFCSNNSQENLLSELNEASEDFKKLIIKWKWLLRSTANADRNKSYTQAGISIPKK